MTFDDFRLAHYVYFNMYRPSSIEDLYTVQGRPWYILLSIIAYLLKFGLSLLVAPWTIVALLPRYRHRIMVFFMSKNNLDALKPIHHELGTHALLVTAKQRLRRDALVMPMCIAFALSFVMLPKLLTFYLKANPVERKTIIVFLHEMWISLGYDGLCKIYLWILSPRAVVFGNDHLYHNRLLVEVAEAREIPCFLLQHSSAYDYMPKVFSSHALLEGIHARDKYLAAGSDAARITLVGMPKLDAYAHHRNQSNAVRRLGICTTPSMNPADVRQLVRFMWERFPELSLILRPHPGRETRAKYADLIREKRLDYSDPRTQDVFVFLQDVDAVISGNSSILLEAALLNVVALYYAGSMTKFYYRHDRYDKYDYVKNKVAVAVDDLSSLNEILHTITQRKPNVREFAKLYCDVVGTDREGKSAQHAADFIVAHCAR